MNLRRRAPRSKDLKSIAQSLPLQRMESALPKRLQPERKRGGSRQRFLLLLAAAGFVGFLALKKLRGQRKVEQLGFDFEGAGREHQHSGTPGGTGHVWGVSESGQGRTIEVDRQSMSMGPAILEGRENEDKTAQELTGLRVLDVNGEEIGSVETVYHRGEQRPPEWIAVNLGGLSPRRAMVPIEDASISAHEIRVAYPEDMIRESPQVQADDLSEDEETRLFSYYNLRRVAEGDDAGLKAHQERLRPMRSQPRAAR